MIEIFAKHFSLRIRPKKLHTIKLQNVIYRSIHCQCFADNYSLTSSLQLMIYDCTWSEIHSQPFLVTFVILKKASNETKYIACTSISICDNVGRKIFSLARRVSERILRQKKKVPTNNRASIAIAKSLMRISGKCNRNTHREYTCTRWIFSVYTSNDILRQRETMQPTQRCLSHVYIYRLHLLMWRLITVS